MGLPHARGGRADWYWVQTIIVNIRRKRNVSIEALKNLKRGWREQQGIIHQRSARELIMGSALRLSHSVQRAGGSKWYELYGEFAELWFFLMKTKGTDVSSPVPLPEWTNLWHFGFGLFEPGRIPDLTAFTNSGERT